MTTPALLVSLASAALALLLAWRAVASRRMPSRTLIMMALAWAAIIACLAIALQRLGAS